MCSINLSASACTTALLMESVWHMGCLFKRSLLTNVYLYYTQRAMLCDIFSLSLLTYLLQLAGRICIKLWGCYLVVYGPLWLLINCHVVLIDELLLSIQFNKALKNILKLQCHFLRPTGFILLQDEHFIEQQTWYTSH